jgi:SAGA-associated factor 73
MANSGDPGRGTHCPVPAESAKGLRYFDIKLGAYEIYKRPELILSLLAEPGSLVDASGYTFTDKDTKPGKIKVKKTSKASTKKKADGTAPRHVLTGINNTNKHTDAKDGPIDTSPTASPLPTLDSKVVSVFPTGRPREDDLLETVICKHCKRPTLKQTAADHVRGCLKAKQEKARKKKEARDAANRLKAGDDRDDDGADKADGDNPNMGQKSAKKSATKGTEDGNRKGKKRKADEDDGKESKKKKKKDEPKQKTAKPKGPVDVEKQCGVTLPNGAQCARSLTCKSHSMGAKRSVPGRTLPYDMLLQQYQKKNQARQQSKLTIILFMFTIDDEMTNPFEQRLLSMQTLLCRKISRTQVPLTQTKKGTPSWPPLPALHPSLLFATPSSPPSRNTDTSASRSRCHTPWEFGMAVVFSQTTIANPYLVASFFRPLRPI